MLTRTRNAEWLNAVANDPEVRPWVGFPELGPVDFSPVLEQPETVALVNDHGGFLCVPYVPGYYGVHVLFRPAGRVGVLETAREGAAWMFAHGAQALFAHLLPKSPARRLVRLMGFDVIRDGAYVLSRARWEQTLCRQ